MSHANINANHVEFSVDTVGSAGSAAGSVELEQGVSGAIAAINIALHASAPVTTVVTVKISGDLFEETVLEVTNPTSTTIYRPLVTPQINDGTDISDLYIYYLLSDQKMTVEIASSDALTAAAVVIVTLL